MALAAGQPWRLGKHALNVIDGHDGAGVCANRGHFVGEHVSDQAVKQSNGIGNNRLVTQTHTVQQPARKLQFAQQHRSPGEFGVDVAAATGAVAFQGELGVFAARREQPVHVSRRVANRELRPTEHAVDAFA